MLTKPEFAQQIRQALENLHDFARLQTLALIGGLSAPDQTVDQGVRQLRTELLDAIEALHPPDSLPLRARERRPYQILYGYYVQGMKTDELVEELAISVRQLRREHKRALAAVIDLLWDRLSPRLTARDTPPDTLLVSASTRQEAALVEAEQLIIQAQAEDLDLSVLVKSLLSVLAPIAGRRSADIIDRLPEDLPPIHAGRIVLRQGMMEVLSFGIDCAAQGTLLVEGRQGDGGIHLAITALGVHRPENRVGVSLAVSQRLLESLGGTVTFADEPQQWRASITLPPARVIQILVMDDNAGLVELFRRYLAGHNYHVEVARTVEQAMQWAREVDPALILLDVMMPDQDGWEILQRLRAAAETQTVPIVVCSVLNEPEIAHILGASDYLAKPVTQETLLAKVSRWCSAPSAPAAPPPATPADRSKSPSV